MVGKFLKGDMHGPGIYEKNGKWEYASQKKHEKDGLGVHFDGEDQYCGLFTADIKTGFGKQINKNEKVYRGMFLNHKYNGYGEDVSKSG